MSSSKVRQFQILVAFCRVKLDKLGMASQFSMLNKKN